MGCAPCGCVAMECDAHSAQNQSMGRVLHVLHLACSACLRLALSYCDVSVEPRRACVACRHHMSGVEAASWLEGPNRATLESASTAVSAVSAWAVARGPLFSRKLASLCRYRSSEKSRRAVAVLMRHRQRAATSPRRENEERDLSSSSQCAPPSPDLCLPRPHAYCRPFLDLLSCCDTVVHSPAVALIRDLFARAAT